MAKKERIWVFIISFVAGITLSATSLGSTGHAVSDLAGTGSGLLGIFLFIFGLAGIVFGSRRR